MKYFEITRQLLRMTIFFDGLQYFDDFANQQKLHKHQQHHYLYDQLNYIEVYLANLFQKNYVVFQ